MEEEHRKNSTVAGDSYHQSTGSGARLLEFKFQPHCLSAVWLKESYITFLYLSFLINKIRGIIASTLKNWYEN